MSERFGPFDLHECLGTGGMASVYRASRSIGLGLRREVAIKRLLPHLAKIPLFVRDFVREAKLAVQLGHPNIVKIDELGRVDDTYFIAMELVRGLALDRILEACSAPLPITLALLVEILDALDHVSHFGIVHRDISPSNLIITETGHIKIIDFGVAAGRGRFAAETGLVKGKLGYLAPEATIDPDHLDARADIFSVGVVAWELVAGQRLRLDTWEHSQVVAPSEVRACPRALDRAVLRALAPDRDDRWRSAAEMRTALETIRASVRPIATSADVARWMRSGLRFARGTDPAPAVRNEVS